MVLPPGALLSRQGPPSLGMDFSPSSARSHGTTTKQLPAGVFSS